MEPSKPVPSRKDRKRDIVAEVRIIDRVLEDTFKNRPKDLD